MIVCGAVLLLGSGSLSSNLKAQVNLSQRDPDKASVLVGRVLAYVDSMVIGAGVGPQYQKFIFGVESKGERGQQVIIPVEIVYAFQNSAGFLPHSFFDHSRLYELTAVRDQNCDEKVSVLSYEKNEDETGKPLPSTYILRIMEGFPKDVLKPDLVLPCYILRLGDYRVQK